MFFFGDYLLQHEQARICISCDTLSTTQDSFYKVALWGWNYLPNNTRKTDCYFCSINIYLYMHFNSIPQWNNFYCKKLHWVYFSVHGPLKTAFPLHTIGHAVCHTFKIYISLLQRIRRLLIKIDIIKILIVYNCKYAAGAACDALRIFNEKNTTF